MTRVVALTGNVAAGKSRVANLFEAWGATLIDADALVRQMQRAGEPVHGSAAPGQRSNLMPWASGSASE